MIPSTAMTDAQRKLLFSQMEKESIDKVALEETPAIADLQFDSADNS